MDRCAWCEKPAMDPTIVRGVPYHWVCLKRRAAFLRLRTQLRASSKGDVHRAHRQHAPSVLRRPL